MEAKDFIESKKINFRCAEIQRFSNMETSKLYKLEDLLNEFLKLNQAEVVKSNCEHEESPLFDIHGLEVAKWCLKCGKIF